MSVCLNKQHDVKRYGGVEEQLRACLISALDGRLTNNITFISYCFHSNINASSYIPTYLTSIHSAWMSDRPSDKSSHTEDPTVTLLHVAADRYDSRRTSISNQFSPLKDTDVSSAHINERLRFPFPQSLVSQAFLTARNVAM